MDARSEEVLYSLISEFIRSGRAVGSTTISKRLSSSVSPATVRNVMGDLEKRGLLTHRHTSGGRIPTDKGFRYYVDRLLKLEPISSEKISAIRLRYKESPYSISDIFKNTSKILSSLSSFAGLVVTPAISNISIKHVEFILLSTNRLLGIFIGVDGIVENRIINIEENLTHSDIEKINNYCNRSFYGLTISEAKAKVVKELEEAKREYDRLITRALFFTQEMFLDMERTELIVDGGSQLISSPDLRASEKAASLMDLLEEKRHLISLLNKASESDSVNIFIGSESGYDAISDCSVVTTPYKKGGKILGTLGIIGPTRMDYSKMIPVVDCTAKFVSDFLDGGDFNDQ